MTTVESGGILRITGDYAGNYEAYPRIIFDQEYPLGSVIKMKVKVSQELNTFHTLRLFSQWDANDEGYGYNNLSTDWQIIEFHPRAKFDRMEIWWQTYENTLTPLPTPKYEGLVN